MSDTDRPTPTPSTDAAIPTIVVRTRGLRKNFEAEGAPVRALRGVDFEMRARRVRRGHGAVRAAGSRRC